MLIADLGRREPPGRGVAQIIGLRTPRVLHALFEQSDLPVGVQRVPIEALFGGIGARGGGPAHGPLREMPGDTIGYRSQPGHFRPVIEHDINPVPAEVGRQIGLIERAPFLHPAVELVEPQAAHVASPGQHRVEDGGVGMQLHVAGNAATGAFEGMQLGVVLPAPVGLDDGDGRAGGVVVEGDPADRARLPSCLPAVPLPGAADLRLDVVHDAADGVVVRLVDHPALGLGRGEGPCHRDRLRRGECQIDVADPRPGRVHPLVVLLHGQFAARGRAAGQDILTLLRGEFGLLRSQNGLEAPYRPLRGFRRQSRAVCFPAGQNVLDLGAPGHPAFIRSEDRADAFRCRPVLFPRNVAAVRALAVQEVGDFARGERFGGGDAKPFGQRRVHVPTGCRRRTAVVLAGARLVCRTVEAFTGALPVASPVNACTAEGGDSLVPVHQSRSHKRTKRPDRHFVSGWGAARGIRAALGQPISFTRYQLVKRLPGRKLPADRLSRIARRGGFCRRRRPQALVVVLRHRRHLRRKRLLQQVLAHGARSRRGTRRACPIGQHISVPRGGRGGPILQAGLELPADGLRQRRHKRDQARLVLVHLLNPGGESLKHLGDRRRPGLFGGGSQDFREHLRLRLAGLQQLIQDRQNVLLNLPVLCQLLHESGHGVGHVCQVSRVFRRCHRPSCRSQPCTHGLIIPGKPVRRAPVRHGDG